MATRVTVVGGGVSGISSALTILNEVPNCEVTVISDAFSPNTTGDVSAGMWGPYILGNTAPEHIIKWAKVTWDQFLEWHNSGEDWGVSLTRGTNLSDSPMPLEFWHNIPLGYTTLTKDQCQAWGRKFISGYAFTTLFAEPSRFLPKLMEEIKRRGGTLRQRRLSSLSEACEGADIVVNCSGLGARTLVPDDDVMPIRGQVVRVRAPWVTHYLCDESKDLTYILPNIDCVILGGTCDEGNWDTGVDDATTQRILDSCCKLVPSLKDAEVIRSSAGLRPGRRGGVRLEKDVIRLQDRTVPVVHNYGHSGCGVTLMWGCARDVARLVKEITGRRTSSL